MMSVPIKGDGGLIVISIMNYERPQADNQSDANWLTSAVDITVGPFSGRFGLSLTTQDFVRFNTDLDQMLRTLKGKSIFQTDEDALYLEIEMGSLGHAKVSGIARDSITQSELIFKFPTDQSYLLQTKTALAEVVTRFPVRA
jgi:hypothetical protein